MADNAANAGNGAQDNLTVVLTGKETVVLENRPMPEVKDDGVLVKVMATGICGTDTQYYLRGGAMGRVTSGPHVLGHEAAGLVTAVGKDVTKIKVGDRVAIEPALPCRVCRFCRAGKWNYCETDAYFATPPTDGSMCRWYACSWTNCVPFPTHLSWAEAGCIQPLAVAVQMARRARSLAHTNLAVFGCGPLGLMFMALARSYGAKRIVAIDVSEQRVEFAKTYAATDGIVAPMVKHKTMEEINEVTDKWNDDLGFEYGIDMVAEVSGAESAIQLGVAMLRPGGTFIQAGMGKALTMFPTLEIAAKELDVRGSLRYATGCFEDAIDLLERGLVDVKPLITKTFPLAQSEDAFKAVQSGKEVKIVIMNQE